ncbi:hypothetical protein ACJZ2D_004464 [Fusarium nematophilum]
MASQLDEILAARLADREGRSQRRRLTTFPSSNADFSSNAYLSLSAVPEVRAAYHSLLERHASPPPFLGSGGSRLLDGNSPLAEALEADIATFHGAPAGLLFNSGFDANVGLVSCLPQKGDVVVYDELIHASAHDGMRLSRATRVAFRHNCVDGEGGLDAVLAEVDGDKSVFVLVEGVYSMDGDVAPLREIVACVKRRLPRGNGYILVDEAHSTGLYGEQGRGLVCELGLEGEIFARLHTFGKAMSSFGAIVLCSPTTREYLINYARTLIYTTAMPFPCLASIRVSYDFLKSGKVDARLQHLWGLVQRTHSLLLSLDSPAISVNREAPKSPIIPVFTSQPRSLAQFCQQRGFTVRPIVAPTVPKGSERVRVCVHAGNTISEVEGLAKAIGDWVRNEQKSRL